MEDIKSAIVVPEITSTPTRRQRIIQRVYNLISIADTALSGGMGGGSGSVNSTLMRKRKSLRGKNGA